MGHDSLFGSDDDENEEQDTIESIQDSTVELQDKYDAATGRAVEEPAITIATTKTPNIKGFYLIRNLVPPQMQDALFKRIIAQKAITLEHPQAMLFPRATSSGSDVENCPTYLADFVKLLPDLLKAHLSPEDFDITFDERQPLQTILNLYEPGQGISPHVDLPHRYAQPIIGLSLASAIVMDFLPLGVEGGPAQAVLLRPGDVYVLLHSARYQCKHGIAYRQVDLWEDQDGHVRKLYRGTRVSITFRRMLSATSELLVDA